MSRAAIVEAQRQEAPRSADYFTVADCELELVRLWSRYMDIAQFAEVRRPPR